MQKNLIVVNDWPHYSNKKVLNVLEFYSIGKSIQSVKFIDCMTDTSNISMSVSHFNWLMDFTIEKNNITLKTLELNKLQYNFLGDFISSQKDSLLSDNSIYIYGTILNEKNKNIKFKVIKSIYGSYKAGDIIEFYYKHYRVKKEKAYSSSVEGIMPGENASLIIKDKIFVKNTYIHYNY